METIEKPLALRYLTAGFETPKLQMYVPNAVYQGFNATLGTLAEPLIKDFSKGGVLKLDAASSQDGLTMNFDLGNIGKIPDRARRERISTLVVAMVCQLSQEAAALQTPLVDPLLQLSNRRRGMPLGWYPSTLPGMVLRWPRLSITNEAMSAHSTEVMESAGRAVGYIPPTYTGGHIIAHVDRSRAVELRADTRNTADASLTSIPKLFHLNSHVFNLAPNNVRLGRQLLVLTVGAIGLVNCPHPNHETNN